jgi:hypothetical protein
VEKKSGDTHDSVEGVKSDNLPAETSSSDAKEKKVQKFNLMQDK